ncbi:hypothetical protein HPB48_012369 [Haemaphysalis longicornis]|uniref:Uncharacterized protein n=1 Tax=Haemaphysalis longicornis TaxID=44386 RepID=A0A9J6G1V0_HAELO|nr:hypothetical protein HPB48_012369 [Haemaphysalis longicornis]
MNSTDVLKSAGASSGGDSTRNPLFQSVRKLREFWTRWQNRESKVLTGSLNDPSSLSEDPGAAMRARIPARLQARVPWKSEGASSASTLDRRPVPRCRRLRELARKVSSRLSSSTNDPDDLIDTRYEDADASLDESSAREPFLRERPSELFCGSVMSHHSVTESTLSAYADVSLEMTHRLRSHTSRSSQQQRSTVFPSNLFSRTSLEMCRTSYRRLRTATIEEDDPR